MRSKRSVSSAIIFIFSIIFRNCTNNYNNTYKKHFVIYLDISKWGFLNLPCLQTSYACDLTLSLGLSYIVIPWIGLSTGNYLIESLH